MLYLVKCRKPGGRAISYVVEARAVMDADEALRPMGDAGYWLAEDVRSVQQVASPYPLDNADEED